MPSVRSLIFKYCTYVIKTIVSLGEIILLYSCYTKKKLVCVVIMAFFNYQPSSYSKYIKSNIYSSCNVKSVLDSRCTFLARFYNF